MVIIIVRFGGKGKKKYKSSSEIIGIMIIFFVCCNYIFFLWLNISWEVIRGRNC